MSNKKGLRGDRRLMHNFSFMLHKSWYTDTHVLDSPKKDSFQSLDCNPNKVGNERNMKSYLN